MKYYEKFNYRVDVKQIMDLTPSPFFMRKKQQTLVFDFSNVVASEHNEHSDDESSEVLIGNEEEEVEKERALKNLLKI